MPDAAPAPSHRDWCLADLLASPSRGGRRLQVAPLTILFEPTTAAQSIYFVESGQVHIHQIGPDSSARLVEIHGRGDWFGTPALVEGAVYGSQATAADQSVLWILPARQILESIYQRPQLAVELVSQLAARLQSAQEAAARLVFDSCNQRLVQTLLQFSHTPVATAQECGDVVLRMTHQQLAQAIGVARETVSLALTQLRQRNLLRTGRNRVCFNLEVLRQFYRGGQVRPAASPRPAK